MTPTEIDLINAEAARGSRRLRPSFPEYIRTIARDRSAAIEHELRVKAAVDPVDLPYSGLPGYSAFVDAFQAASVLSQIGATPVPFSSNVTVLTEPPVASWVARGDNKPAQRAAVGRANLDPLKVAALLPMSKELLRFSGPAADAALSRTLENAAVRAVNGTLLSAAAPSSNESPAGLAHDLISMPSSGLADDAIFTDVLAMLDGLRNPVLVGALGYILRVRAAFRGAEELRAIVSPDAGGLLFAIDEGAVAYAFGGINVDASDQASILMSDAPGSDENAALVSMYQTNSVALRVDCIANWEVVNPDGVRVVEMEAAS